MQSRAQSPVRQRTFQKRGLILEGRRCEGIVRAEPRRMRRLLHPVRARSPLRIEARGDEVQVSSGVPPCVSVSIPIHRNGVDGRVRLPSILPPKASARVCDPRATPPTHPPRAILPAAGFELSQNNRQLKRGRMLSETEDVTALRARERQRVCER